MESSNGQKSQHGYDAQDSISNLLKFCAEFKYLTEITSKYRDGMEGYAKQFYAPFKITFADNESWIIYSTTSLRSDRVKEQQWDSSNLKAINHKIKKAYLVFPDEEYLKKSKQIKEQNKKYKNHVEFSAIDAIISQNELYNLIEKKVADDLPIGKAKDIKGRIFENRISMCLSYPSNLEIWKNNDRTSVGLYYPFFEQILNYLALTPSKVISINASADKTDIGRLPSGGNPKTDVIMRIGLSDSTTETVTISCKRSGADRVSVHEYSADEFSRVLDPSNQRLHTLLRDFQSYPSLHDFGEENVKALTQELQPYTDKLARWVLGGIGGPGNPETQWATHILTYDDNNDSIAFHSVDKYINLLKSENVDGHFGTFFSWTYPSKKRGRSIQLKCKIIR